MITNTKKTTLVVLFIFVIGIVFFISFWDEMSLRAKRTTLMNNPPPVPWYLPRLIPPPGAQIPKSLWDAPGVSPTICFETKHVAVLGEEIDSQVPRGVEIDARNTPGFAPFVQLELNGEIINGPEIYTSEEELKLCWAVIELLPGDYLAKLRLEGLLTKEFEWAFRITDE